MLYSAIRKVLFQFDAEKMHDLTIDFCQKASLIPGLQSAVKMMYGYNDPRLEVTIGNLRFSNPIGLAAGFDKNGVAINLLQNLGFGTIEVGTTTPKPQPGNPKPRLYRIKEERAIINQRGFNNDGIDMLINHIKIAKPKSPIGINIGKNKNTSMSSAVDDYIIGIKKAWLYSDYITINISSPNTPDLRLLQKKEHLDNFLSRIMDTKNELSNKYHKKNQIWLKIDPDLNDKELETIAELALLHKIDALVITNTTLYKQSLKPEYQNLSGGLSGKPLLKISNEVLRRIYLLTKGEIPLVGVGGVFSTKDAYQKILLGASLVQIYTGLVYNGPKVVKNIKLGLINRLEQEQCKNIMARIGVLT